MTTVGGRIASSVGRLAWVGVPAFALVATIFVGVRVAGLEPWADPMYDMWAYWSTRFGLDYATAIPGHTGHYIYSPAFAHLVAPLASLPWPWFAGLWTAILIVVVWWLGGRWALPLALLPPVALSVGIGQVDVLMAAAVVVGFRWPAAWALPILTKVTPGIGLLWFATRREWRSLGIALAATAAIVGLSALVDPAAWRGWLAMLLRFDFPDAEVLTYLPVPVWARLPIVAAFVVWGARTDRRWTLPISAMLGLPTVWLNSPAILLGLLPLVAAGARTPAGAWLRSPDAEPVVVRRRLAAGVAGAVATLSRALATLAGALVRLDDALARLGTELERVLRSVRRTALGSVAVIRGRSAIERLLSRRPTSIER